MIKLFSIFKSHRFNPEHRKHLNLHYDQNTTMDSDTNIDHIKKKIDELNQKAWDCRVSDSIQSLDLSREAVQLSEEYDYKKGLAEGLRTMSFSYIRMAQNQEAEAALNKSRALFEELNDQQGLSDVFEYYNIINRFTGKYESSLDQALRYCSQSLAISEVVNDQKGQGNALLHMATIYQQMGQMENARIHAQKSLGIRQKIGDKKGEAEVVLFLSSIHSLPQEKVQHFQFLQQALNKAEETGALDLQAKVHWQYYKSFKECSQPEDALKHLELYEELEKKLNKDALNQKVLNMEISHRAEQSKKEAEIFRLRNIELVGLYEETRRQKEEIEKQKKQIDDSFDQLKATQAQLIHAEKMASLGELTAGVAHEIQNPLNFIKNFSEVNLELAEELIHEFTRFNIPDNEITFLKKLIEDFVMNLQKISHHGNRADGIVKSMLQHSRKSTGQKEPADINAIVEEYLRLSYHGLRAKDKNINAVIETEFDENTGFASIEPQDIGRVLLNLFNNAFYSVSEKLKQGHNDYEPIVSVKTKRMNDHIEIRVRDNGLGIPENCIDKIFQPFYTTKPTGEGTGLGLSLSYDIITKEHGGELSVESKEGEWAEFILLLPEKSL